MLRSTMLITTILCVSVPAHTQSPPPDIEAVRQAAIASGLEGRLDSYCMAARPDDSSAIVVHAEPVTAEMLASKVDAVRRGDQVVIGPFRYDGRGMMLTSTDPRFRHLKIDPSIAQPRLASGERLVVSNLLWARQGGTCRLAPTTTEYPSNPRFPESDRAGATMSLAGHEPVASYAVGYGENAKFLGLMKPDQEESATVLVTFGPGPSSQTHVVARLPLAFQGLTIVPPLHGGDASLRLTGLQTDGRLIDLLLWFDPRTDWP